MFVFAKMTFTFDMIPSLKGKTVIVTGANSGIGRVTAVEMASQGAHVILACRSLDRTQPVLDEIKEYCPKGSAEFIALDLSSLKSVKTFADKFKVKRLPLDVLINNAGIMALPHFETTQVGIEMHFGVNYVADHTAITNH